METTPQELVLYALEDGVARITLNRPERGNGWIDPLGRRYFALLEQAARDSQVKAIVVTGAGKTFSIGGDSEALTDLTTEALTIGERPYWFPLSVGKPIIGAINGACFGVGMQQALCCDIRIAGDDAKFSTAYARRGLVAEYGMGWALPRLVGVGHAMDLLLSGRLVRAPEAERMGLVNRVVPAAELVAQAMAYAGDLARNCSPHSMRVLKRQCYADLMTSVRTAYTQAEKLLDQALASADFREGVASWQEQRPPAFPELLPGDALIDVD